MSGEVLREAATLMRERAKEASYGDAAWCPDYLYSAVRNMQRNCDWDCPKHEPFDGPDSPEECAQPTRFAGYHIASWHPAVALAVAELLDNAAEDYDLRAPGGELHFDFTVHVSIQRALAVARTYLGRPA